MSEPPDLSDRIASLTPEQREQLRLRVQHQRQVVSDKPIAIERDPNGDVFPASAGQERLTVLHERAQGSGGYTLPMHLFLRGDLDANILAESFTRLVRHHEALRTRFQPSKEHDRIVQVLDPPHIASADFAVADATRTEMDAAMAALRETSFDLAKDRLLRARLWRLTDTEEPSWALGLTVHHIVVDGWSLNLMLRDLSTIYTALRDGEEPRLTPVAFGVPEFARWQQNWLSSPDSDHQRAFWRQTLEGVDQLNVPGDRARPAHPSFRSSLARFTLPPDVVGKLEATARRCETTLFSPLLAVFAHVLKRWSGQREIVIGTPVAGRSRPEFEDTVGFFVNTVALRLDLADDTIGSLVANARSVLGQALDHADLPYNEVVRAVEPSESRNALGLFQAMLTLNSQPLEQFELPDVHLEIPDQHPSGTELDFSLDLSPTQDGALTGWLICAADLFDQSTADELAASITTALSWLDEDKLDVHPNEIPVVAPSSRQVLIEQLSGIGRPPYPGRPLQQWFTEAVERGPDRIALVTDSETGNCNQLTYRDLDELSNQAAHWLKQEGVRSGDRVAICLRRQFHLVAAVLGALKAGGVCVPLDPDHPYERIRGQIDDVKASLVLAEDDTDPRLGEGLRIVGLEDARRDWEQLPRTAVESSVTPQDSAYILFTSGSTGHPKGVELTHHGIGNRMLGMRDELGFGPDDIVLHKSTMSADPALWEILVPLFSGARCVLAVPGLGTDPSYLHGVLARQRVTACEFIPSLLRPVLARPGLGNVAQSLRIVLSAGEVLSPSLAKRLLAALPDAALWNCYGPTETTLDITTLPVSEPVPAVIPIGYPVRGSELYVVDPDMSLQPRGAAGELVIGGTQIALGYIGRPEQTEAVFVPHPFRPDGRVYRSGDRVRWTSGGALQFLGRIDRQVKVHGYRVEPAEVEQILREQPGVEDAAVITREDGSGSVEIHGYVTARDPRVPPSVIALRRQLAARTPSPMIPATIMVLAQFPVTTSGKVNLAALPEPVTVLEQSSRPPADAIEKVLASMWGEALAVSNVGAQDSFFELGGNSLIATLVVSRARETFEVEMPLHFFMETPTIEAMAQLARRQGIEGGIDVERIAELYLQVMAMSEDEVAAQLDD